jgi:trimeric autotransporter adhesin
MKTTFIFLISLTTVLNRCFSMTDSGNNTVLSITLASFDADFSAKGQVNLAWNTMMELNVDHFEIQRSGDAMNFQSIDTVSSKMKSNTNSYQLQYSYTDVKPLSGTSYYRIAVVGKNGNTYQSTIVRISNNTSTEETKIYPTLVQNNIVYVESEKNLRNVKMEFYDLSGNMISQTSWASVSGKENVQVSKSGSLHHGTYIARLTANGNVIKNQVVIVQ